MSDEDLDAILDRWRKSDGSYPAELHWLVETVRQSRADIAALRADLDFLGSVVAEYEAREADTLSSRESL